MTPEMTSYNKRGGSPLPSLSLTLCSLRFTAPLLAFSNLRLFICVHQRSSVVALPPCNLACGSRVSMLRLRTMRVRVPFREPVTVALDTLRAHKLRSFLMLLGIILSVSTLIVVVGLIEGTNRYIASRVANLGANVFLVLRFPIITEAEAFIKATRRNKNVTWEDYEALRDTLTLPRNVGVEVRNPGKVRAGTETLEEIDIRGVTANIGEMDIEEPAAGRYISDGDDRSEERRVGKECRARRTT